MSQPFLLRKETPWHDSISSSWPTHPTRRTHRQTHTYFCVNSRVQAPSHIDGHTKRYCMKPHEHTPLTCCICCNTPRVRPQQYSVMDTVTVCLPWCKKFNAEVTDSAEFRLMLTWTVLISAIYWTELTSDLLTLPYPENTFSHERLNTVKFFFTDMFSGFGNWQFIFHYSYFFISFHRNSFRSW